MIRRLALSKVYGWLEAGPVVLLATAERGKANVMTMSWHTMLDFDPPLLACVVGEGDHSFRALRRTGECVIAIPGAGMAERVVGIGNCSGREVDKFARFGLKTRPASQVRAPLLPECAVNLECRVVDTRMVRRYDLFVLEGVVAWQDSARRRCCTTAAGARSAWTGRASRCLRGCAEGACLNGRG